MEDKRIPKKISHIIQKEDEKYGAHSYDGGANILFKMTDGLI
jgi:hypothetical protein